MSVSFNGSTSSEEQEADSLTESQADAQNDDKSTNPRARAILSHITSHVEKCSLESCKTCRELRRISEDIETIPVHCCEDLWIPAGSITPRSTLLDYTRSLPRHRYASTRTVSKVNTEFEKKLFKKSMNVNRNCAFLNL